MSTLRRTARRIPRPSPAMVVAVIALIVAIGGTATALPGRFGVGHDDLKKNSVGARALGRVVEQRAVIWSKDQVADDGTFTETEGQALCPNRAPFGFDPTITGLGPWAFEIQRKSILSRLGSPRGYRFRLLTDGGPAGYSVVLNCLPRR